ncbi:MAG: SDR family oxidoreductase [Chitinophagaceae bacterium]|nr:SDR family oxidoreductase [Chitinophagaceae bacterium]
MNNRHGYLSEKTVVITGASSGVGRAMAIELAQSGANLVLAARRSEALEEVAAECNELGGNAIAVVTDVRSADSIKLLAEKSFIFGGKIDVWINNAGVLAAGALDEIPANVNEEIIKTNLIGYILGAQAVIPYFKKQGYGTLINNISVGGWFAVPYGAAYTASKFGIRGFSEALKGELNNYRNIHVCDLFPGFLDTPGIQHAANYTGKAIMPAPPVYHPQKVASAVKSLIENPRSSTTVGAAAGFLGLSYRWFPLLSRNITASIVRSYLKNAEPSEITSGNSIHPVYYGTSVEGGWRKSPRQILTARKAGILVAGIVGLVVGFSMFRK